MQIILNSAMLVLIDNYDSFTYNLVHYFEEIGEKVKKYLEMIKSKHLIFLRLIQII